MTPPVKLTDMLEGLEWQADEGASYLHTTTGDVVSVTLQEGRAVEAEEPLEGVPAWQHDTMRIALAVVAQITLSSVTRPLRDQCVSDESGSASRERMTTCGVICWTPYVVEDRSDGGRT